MPACQKQRRRRPAASGPRLRISSRSPLTLLSRFPALQADAIERRDRLARRLAEDRAILEGKGLDAAIAAGAAAGGGADPDAGKRPAERLVAGRGASGGGQARAEEEEEDDGDPEDDTTAREAQDLRDRVFAERGAVRRAADLDAAVLVPPPPPSPAAYPFLLSRCRIAVA
jgi:hypothetical protein